jgi:hypothetical protein
LVGRPLSTVAHHHGLRVGIIGSLPVPATTWAYGRAHEFSFRPVWVFAAGVGWAAVCGSKTEWIYGLARLFYLAQECDGGVASDMASYAQPTQETGAGLYR